MLLNAAIATFDITKEALPDLLLRIQQGKVQIPDLQRSFCWSDELVIELLASISLGWPVGAIMLLEQGNATWSFRPRPVEGLHLQQAIAPTHLILDGQQRATTLYMCLFSGEAVRIRAKRSSRFTERWYYIDIVKALDPDVERSDAIISLSKNRVRSSMGAAGTMIDCATPEKEYQLGLFPVTSIFHYAQWRQQYSRYWQYNATHLELLDRFEQEVIKRFEHYQVPVIQLKSELPKRAVCKVFEKTNTQGTELNFFDLATANFARDDFSLRSDWARREERLKKQKVLQSLRSKDFLACVTLVATYRRRERVLGCASPTQLPAVGCGCDAVMSLSLEEYESFAESVLAGYEMAARFLHGQKFHTAEDLPYQIQLVALAAILSITGPPPEQMRSKLEQWFWCGSCAELYTSWHEARAARDMLEVPEWLLKGGATPTTISDASFSDSRLLDLRQRRGSVFKSISALLRRHGAIDFVTGEMLSDVRYFDEPIESHHIFPVAYCKRQGISDKCYNCLVNLSPLSQMSNRKINGKAPSQYLQNLEAQGISRQRLDVILRSHLIEPETLWADDFEAFLATRSQALLSLVQSAMGRGQSVQARVTEIGSA